MGNSSGKYKGNQPKYVVLTSLIKNTTHKNIASAGVIHQKIQPLKTSEPRLMTKYVNRLPIKLAIQPPNRLPMAAPVEP